MWDWVRGEGDTRSLKAADCMLIDFMGWGWQLNVGAVEIFVLKQAEVNVVAVEVLKVVLEMVLSRESVGSERRLSIG